MSIVLGLACVAVLVLIAGRYGADSRSAGDPTGRDAAWTARPSRPHDPRTDLRAVRALARLWAGQLRAQHAFDRHLRPWEGSRCELTPRW